MAHTYLALIWEYPPPPGFDHTYKPFTLQVFSQPSLFRKWVAQKKILNLGTNICHTETTSKCYFWEGESDTYRLQEVSRLRYQHTLWSNVKHIDRFNSPRLIGNQVKEYWNNWSCFRMKKYCLQWKHLLPPKKRRKKRDKERKGKNILFHCQGT